MMSAPLATLLVGAGIAALFLLDRDHRARTSPALWIPVIWICIAASRMVSQWLDMAPPTDSPDHYIDGSPLDRLIFALLVVTGAMVLIARGRRASACLLANAPLAVFLLYGAVSVLWSDYPSVAVKRWIKAAGDLIMVMVVLTDPDPAAAVRRFLTRAAFLLIPVSFLLVKYYPELGRAYHPWTRLPSYVGVTTSKNGLGYVCLIFGLASVWRLLAALPRGTRSLRWGPLLAHGAILALALWLLVKSDSATALACFVGGMAVLLLTRVRSLARTPLTVHALAVSLVIVVVFGLVLGWAVNLVAAFGRDTTFTGRTELWADVLRMLPDPFMGTGFDSFWLGERAEWFWRKHWWHPNQAHNGYLEIFVNLGAIGLLLFAAVLAWGYWNVSRAYRDGRPGARLRLAYLLVAAVYNLVEAAFKALHPVGITFLLAIAQPSDGKAEEHR
jgi:exopolysaccharide production protein ExoQ